MAKITNIQEYKIIKALLESGFNIKVDKNNKVRMIYRMRGKKCK